VRSFVVEGLAAVTSSDRLRLVEDGVGFEPTEPPRRWKTRGSPECKSGSTAPPPVLYHLTISPPG
jgi:hypothetical protein